MDEKKQIEEMAKAIVDREKYNVCGYTTCKTCDIGKCDLHCSKYSDISYDCEALYDKGYRKQSDTVREVLQKMLGKMYKLTGCGVPYHVKKFIEEIADEYGVNWEDL